MASPFGAITKASIEWAVAWKDRVADAVRSEAPVGGTRQLSMFSGKDDSTTLQASIRGRASGRVGGAMLEVLAGVSYALIIRDGRGIVVPVNAQVLHWVDEEGQDVFSMTSKAVEPNPYGERGWEKVKAEAMADLGRRLAKAATAELLATARAGGMKVGL
jgi:hypothetical protein